MEINRKLLDVLHDLDKGNKSGILRFQKQTVKKQLVLHEGLLVYAESNLPQEHLARVMIAMDLLSKDKLNEVASLMKAGKTSEEAILELCGPNTEALEKGRREQASIIMSSLFSSNEWDFQFYPGNGLVRHRLNLQLKVPELILSATRYGISKRLFRLPPQFIDASFIVRDNSGTSPDYPLNDVERKVYSLLQKRAAGSSIASHISGQCQKPDEILMGLFMLGLISMHQSKSAQGSEESESAEQKLDEMLVRFQSASLYEVLSVPVEAKQEEIQSAYHEQAKHLHPDRFQSLEFSDDVRNKAQQVFARINEAYLTLRNRSARAEYDRKQAEPKGNQQQKSGILQPEEAAEALFREGRSLLAKGEIDVAVERLKGSVWLCPDKAIYNYFLGVAESKIPKLRKSAEQHLLKAIALEDVSAASHLALARLYIDVRLPAKAALELQCALNWDPDNSEARRLGEVLKKLL